MIGGLMLFTPVEVIVIDLYLLPKSGACKKCSAGLSLPSLISSVLTCWSQKHELVEGFTTYLTGAWNPSLRTSKTLTQ